MFIECVLVNLRAGRLICFGFLFHFFLTLQNLFLSALFSLPFSVGCVCVCFFSFSSCSLYISIKIGYLFFLPFITSHTNVYHLWFYLSKPFFSSCSLVWMATQLMNDWWKCRNESVFFSFTSLTKENLLKSKTINRFTIQNHENRSVSMNTVSGLLAVLRR